ncbi:matrix [Kern Canyon virus]|uniref:Matrix protein n=1 Tax=Kern Canyon virus TaxID=380433 RepID=A0A0D3R172_9RHAB|nr:matrix [Kern Canyon virus]AJR28351.1 matrix [Kern Canyon virus]
MLSKLKKSFSKKESEKTVMIPEGPPPDYYGGFFYPEPSAPPDELVKTESLYVKAEIVVKSEVPIKEMKALQEILAVWVDKNVSPVQQKHLDTWFYLCLGLHVRRDQDCTYTNMYRAAVDMVVEVNHRPKTSSAIKYIPFEQTFDTIYGGRPCEVSFKNKMVSSKRKGTPAHLLYNQPLKNGQSLPKPVEIFNGYGVEVKLTDNKVHEISLI